MWSKTKQVLESRLPEDLKGRVKYNYDVYRDGSTEIQVFSIIVDGEVWFHTNPKFWDELYKPHPNCCTANEMDVIWRSGYVENCYGSAMKYVHDFLNVLSIEDSATNENYFIRLLALLDSRLGKRRIRKMAQYIDQEPEWFKKWIRLRLGESV